MQDWPPYPGQSPYAFAQHARLTSNTQCWPPSAFAHRCYVSPPPHKYTHSPKGKRDIFTSGSRFLVWVWKVLLHWPPEWLSPGCTFSRCPGTSWSSPLESSQHFLLPSFASPLSASLCRLFELMVFYCIGPKVRCSGSTQAKQQNSIQIYLLFQPF